VRAQAQAQRETSLWHDAPRPMFRFGKRWHIGLMTAMISVFCALQAPSLWFRKQLLRWLHDPPLQLQRAVELRVSITQHWFESASALHAQRPLSLFPPCSVIFVFALPFSAIPSMCCFSTLPLHFLGLHVPLFFALFATHLPKPCFIFYGTGTFSCRPEFRTKNCLGRNFDLAL
jgi:hypothetical protein